MKRSFKKTVIFLILTVIMTVAATMCITASAKGKWIGAWGCGITEIGVGGYDDIGVVIGKATCRSVITPTTSGTKIRLRLSNVYGVSDLKLNRLTIAKSLGGSQIDENTATEVFFNGVRYVTIPAGKEIYSDPIDFPVKALENIAVSTYASQANEFRTAGFSGGYSYLTVGANYTKSKNLGPVCVKMQYSLVSVVPFLSGVDVYSEEDDAYSVVVIGDSTVANEFPYYLAKQINDNGASNVGVVGKGIIGNSLLSDGIGIGSKIYGSSLLNRFDVDALSQAGVEYVVVKIGCNDLIHPKSNNNSETYGIRQPTAGELIAGFSELAERCHKAGVKIVCVALMQWKGYTRDFFGTGSNYKFSADDWAIAQEVNRWMATTNKIDAFVNLNSYSQDPKDPMAISAQYTADGAHPNDTLQLLWAKKFPIKVLGVGTRVKSLSLNKATYNQPIGTSIVLKPTITPTTALNKSVTWSSSDKNICYVNKNGVVTAISKGKCVITCTTNDRGYRASCIINSYIPVTGLSLSSSSLTLYESQTQTVKATIYPANAGIQGRKWWSSNPSVATVDAYGKITAVNKGTAVITCRTNDGSFTKTCKVTVKASIPVTKIAISPSSKYIEKGKESTLTATIYPSNATNRELTWWSSDTSVVKVNQSGLITAVKGGSATITCKSKENGVYDVCRVYVKAHVTSVTLSSYTASIYIGKSFTLKATTWPVDADTKTVTWKSSNPSVATVSSSGVVTGKGAGTAVITCTSTDSGRTKTCTVTVKKWISVSSVKLSPTSKSIVAGTSFSITPTLYPENASNKNVTWKSSNTSVATVSSSGVVTGIKAGSCKITCTSVSATKTATCSITVTTPPTTGVTLNKSTATMSTGSSMTLVATLKPAGASSAVTWSSNKTSVATVSSSGVVKAIAPGTATITVKTASGGYTATCTVTVKNVAVTGVSLNKSSLTVNVGSTAQIYATVQPSNATNKSVTWKSGDTSIATISSTGVIKGIKAGNVAVACLTKDGGYAAICLVAVQGTPALGVKLDATSLTMKPGATYKLTATVLPANASVKTVTWSSSDSSVARVSSSGLVTAVKPGKATITVKTTDGSWTANCSITVKAS